MIFQKESDDFYWCNKTYTPLMVMSKSYMAEKIWARFSKLYSKDDLNAYANDLDQVL